MGHSFVPAFLPVTPIVVPRLRHVARLRMTSHPPSPRLQPQPPAAAAAAASAVAAVAIAGMAFTGGALVAPLAADASVFNFRGERPVGIVGKPSGGDRYLSQCPATNNCVSTSADVYDRHYLPPWTYNPKGEAETVSGAAAIKGKRSTALVEGNQKPMAEAVADLVKVIEDYPGATIITNRPTHSDVGDGWYIYAEFQSKVRWPFHMHTPGWGTCRLPHRCCSRRCLPTLICLVPALFSGPVLTNPLLSRFPWSFFIPLHPALHSLSFALLSSLCSSLALLTTSNFYFFPMVLPSSIAPHPASARTT